MNYLNKYKEMFMNSFSLAESDLEKNPTMQEVDLWDSVGHINFIADLEDAFDIEITIEEMSGLTSFERGKEILKAHNIDI
jgi:acyl carrier protein